MAEWQTYASEQSSHGEPARLSEFWIHFGRATLENWQSEFLQLFSFVVLAAVLIHHGSAESKDGTDRIERKVDEIHSMLQEPRSAANDERSLSRLHSDDDGVQRSDGRRHLSGPSTTRRRPIPDRRRAPR